MYDYILIQWILGAFTAARVQACVTKGYIIQEQANNILATPQAN